MNLTDYAGPREMAGARGAAVAVSASLAGVPGGGLPRQIPHPRSAGITALVVADHRRRDHFGRVLLLPLRDRANVHAGTE